MSKSGKHERAVWEQFWEKKSELSNVYSPSKRIVDNLAGATKISGKKILEVGAGTGRTSFELAMLGAKIFVLDYADNSLQLLKSLFSHPPTMEVHIIQADAFHLPIKDEVLDIVFHQGLLEHFRKPQPIVQENYRVLQRGGLVLVDVPQRFHVYTIIKHVLIWLNAWFAGWETEFSSGQLTRMVIGAGFKINKSYGEWMHPSLFYRLVREASKKIGITLPMQPHGPKVLRRIRSFLRNQMQKLSVMMYTYLDIGVIGEK